MWDLPGPGLEPVSPALAGRFLTTAPPGKPLPEVILKDAKRQARGMWQPQLPPHITLFMVVHFTHKNAGCLLSSPHLLRRRSTVSVFRRRHKLYVVGRTSRWSPGLCPLWSLLWLCSLLYIKREIIHVALNYSQHLKSRVFSSCRQKESQRFQGWEGVNGLYWFEDRGGHMRRNIGDLKELR